MDSDINFTMTEPAEHGSGTKYAFWLETKESRLFRYVRTLICVVSVKMVSSEKALVGIHDDYDADEAWHYIRTEIEEESRFVTLDKMWEDAMKWL